MGQLKKWLSQISLPVYVLAMVFAIASWIDINGMWVELPLMVNVLPEGWGLPAYLSLISQVANIGPIAYVIANRCAGTSRTQLPTIYSIIVVGSVSCFLLAFLWDRTSLLAGEEHSTALLVLAGCLSLVDCTSSVAFLPYMSLFKPHYMTGYYIGEGLSGFIPGIVGLIQGIGSEPTCVNASVAKTNETTGENYTEYSVYPVYDPPLFPVRDFFIFLAVMIFISGIAFTFLNYLPSCKAERLSTNDEHTNHEKSFTETNGKSETSGPWNQGSSDILTLEEHISVIDVKSENTPAHSGNNYANNNTGVFAELNGKSLTSYKKPRHKLTKGEFVYVLLLTGLSCALTNTVLTSISSYTSLPYGDVAYTLALRLSALANPLACFIALFFPSRSLVTMGLLTSLGTALMGYQMYLAVMSPFPPLKGTDTGTALTVASQVLIVGVLSYQKVSAAIITNDSGGHNALLWVGGVTQIGSCIGAIAMFVVINVYYLFESEFPCSNL